MNNLLPFLKVCLKEKRPLSSQAEQGKHLLEQNKSVGASLGFCYTK